MWAFHNAVSWEGDISESIFDTADHFGVNHKKICAVFADGSVECVRVIIDRLSITPVTSAPAGRAMIGCP